MQFAIVSRILQRGTVFFILVGLFLFFALANDRFTSQVNLMNILVQNAHIVVVALGVGMTMIMGGIDLSVGSVAAIAGTLSAGLIARQGVDPSLAIIMGMSLGVMVGILNGVLIVYGKLPPFVVTLASLTAGRGIVLVYTEGRPIAGLGDLYSFWGRGDIGGVSTQVILALAVVLIVWFILTQTRYGTHLYAIGGSEETARLAGVPVDRVKIITYAMSGLLAALTGIMLTARVASAQPQMAAGLELNAIAAAVLGGVSLFGGVGSVWGVVAGTLIVGVLNNGMNLLRVAPYTKQVIQGIVLVIAVLIDVTVNQRRLEASGSRIRGAVASGQTPTSQPTEGVA